MIVVFDVVAGDLQIVNLRAFDPNPTEPIVADVISADVSLVQIDTVEKHAHARIVINVRILNLHIAVALVQSDAVPHLPDQHSLQNRLHRCDQFHAVGLGIRRGDLDVAHRRHALTFPDVRLHGVRIARSLVRANDSKRRPLARHDDRRCAVVTVDPNPSDLVQLDFDRLADEVVAARKLQPSIRVRNRMANCLRIVRFAVSRGAKSLHVAHNVSKVSLPTATDASQSLRLDRLRIQFRCFVRLPALAMNDSIQNHSVYFPSSGGAGG